jgi:hypothetical protein
MLSYHFLCTTGFPEASTARRVNRCSPAAVRGNYSQPPRIFIRWISICLAQASVGSYCCLYSYLSYTPQDPDFV